MEIKGGRRKKRKKRKRGEKKRRRKRRKRRGRKKKSGRNWGTYKLQRKSMVMMNLNQALKGYEWGKLGWHWNSRNEEECKEKRRRRIGEEIAGSEMEEKKRKGIKSSNKRKGWKCQGILRKSSQWCNWDMKGGKGELGNRTRIEIQEKEEQLHIN